MTAPKFLESQFRRSFRVPSRVFQYVQNALWDALSTDDQNFGGRTPISPEKKVAIFLKYIGSTETILHLSQLFDICEASLIRVRRQVVDAILSVLLQTTVKWPAEAEYEGIARVFLAQDWNNFDAHVIGALDGCHIPISTPRENPRDFYNRKKFHSVVRQAVCREDLRFTDISVGLPGKMHDARILRMSNLWQTGMGKCMQGYYSVLGDAAYPLTRWLLTPYRDHGNLTPNERRYNGALATRRCVIERAFGVLKRRFRRLQVKIDMHSIDEINALIVAACVMHNLCMLYDDDTDFEPGEVINENGHGAVPLPADLVGLHDRQEGALKRIIITNNL